MMLVFGGLIIVGIVVLVRALSNRTDGRLQGQDSAMETLRRRYATGEITKEQFQDMKRTLG